jgi:hypothetical protein
VAEVLVDAALAAATSGEAGVTLSSGPKLGADFLSEILCGGKVRLVVSELHQISYSDLGLRWPRGRDPTPPPEFRRLQEQIRAINQRSGNNNQVLTS